MELGRQLQASAVTCAEQPTVAAQEMAGIASTMQEVKSSISATIDIKIYRSSLPIVSHSVYCMVEAFSCLKGVAMRGCWILLLIIVAMERMLDVVTYGKRTSRVKLV